MAAKVSGGGKGKYALGQNSEINVTPFVDVMLVLLIIFMVAAPLATTSIRIDLPPAHDAGQKNQNRPTFLSVRRGGEVFIVAQNSTRKAPDLAHLTSILGPMLGGIGAPQEQTVLIRADRDVRYKEFMGVVNQLYRDGYYKVGLISEELG